MNGHNLRGITHPQNSWNKITIPWAGWGGGCENQASTVVRAHCELTGLLRPPSPLLLECPHCGSARARHLPSSIKTGKLFGGGEKADSFTKQNQQIRTTLCQKSQAPLKQISGEPLR